MRRLPKRRSQQYANARCEMRLRRSVLVQFAVVRQNLLSVTRSRAACAPQRGRIQASGSVDPPARHIHQPRSVGSL